MVCLLLQQHGPLIPPAYLAVLHQQLCSSISRTLAALNQAEQPQPPGGAGAGQSGRRSASPVAAAAAATAAAAPGGSAVAAAVLAGRAQEQLLWLLRCATELAVCWPACLHPLAAADGAGGATRDNTGRGSSSGHASFPAAAAVAAGGPGVSIGLGPGYDASEGQCSKEPWAAEAAAAAAALSSRLWHQLWDDLEGRVSAGSLVAGPTAVLHLQDATAWLLHVLVVQHLVQLPSKQAAVLKLVNLWLPPAGLQPQQQLGGESDADDPHGQQQQQQVALTDAQLALLLTLCLNEPVSSQKEVLLRQELFQACLGTAEACCSSGAGARHSSGHRAVAAAVAAAAASPAAHCLPPLLLAAILALLEAPGLPTPGLNGAPAVAAGAVGTGAATSAGFSVGPAWVAGHPSAASAHPCSQVTVWYDAADVWWWADRRVEVQLAGLESGLEHLLRQQAALQRQELLQRAASAAAVNAAVSGGGRCHAPLGADGDDDSGNWWKCWQQLADGVADVLANVSGLGGLVGVALHDVWLVVA